MYLEVVVAGDGGGARFGANIDRDIVHVRIRPGSGTRQTENCS